MKYLIVDSDTTWKDEFTYNALKHGKWLHNCNQISEIKKVKAVTESKSANARYLMTAKVGVCSLGSWMIFAHRNEIAEYANGRNYKESSHNG